MHRALAYLQATLNELPKAEPGSYEAREFYAIERELLRAKARMVSLQRRKEAA